MSETNTRPTLAVPTAEGITDGIEALMSSHKKGEWILLAPDGRLWLNVNPMMIFAALASVMRGEDMKFGRN